MHIDELIARLGTELNISDLGLNSDNVCRLVLNDSVAIGLEWHDDLGVLHLYCSIGVIPEYEDADGWMRLVLGANLYGKQTGGAAIAYDLEEGEIVLCRRFVLQSCSFLQFFDELEQFGQAALYWTRRLRQPLDPETLDDASDEEKHIGQAMQV